MLTHLLIYPYVPEYMPIKIISHDAMYQNKTFRKFMNHKTIFTYVAIIFLFLAQELMLLLIWLGDSHKKEFHITSH